MKKRLFSAILALCMGFTPLSAVASASGEDIRFSPPAVTELTVTYQANGTEQAVSLLQERPEIILPPDSKPVFSVTFDSSQRLDQVFVTSTKEGEVKYLEASPGEEGTYVTDGYFDPEDTSYLPGTIGVEYTKKVIPVTTDSAAAPDIHMTDVKTKLEEQGIWMEGDLLAEEDGTVRGQIIFGESFDTLYSNGVLIDGSVSKLYISDELDEYALHEWFDPYYECVFENSGDCSSYALTGPEDKSYTLYWAEKDLEGSAAAILHDQSENSYTRLLLSSEATIGGIGDALSLTDFVCVDLLEYCAVSSETGQLPDKNMFLLTTACLPLFAETEASEASALLFSAVLNSFTSRVGRIQGCPPIQAVFSWDSSSGGDPEPCEHIYTSAVTSPTCTQQGYTTYTCVLCGETYTAGYTEALGHSWGEWITTKFPTPAEDGRRERTCSRCGHTETDLIPATGFDIPSDQGSHSDSSDSSAPSEPVTTSKENVASSAVTTVTPDAVINESTAAAALSPTGAAAALLQAQSGQSGQVVIAPEISEAVSRIEMSVPGSFLSRMSSLTRADLVLRTPVAQLLIPNSSLQGLGGGGNVTVTAALDKNVVELFMTRGTQVVDRFSGGVVLTVPMAASTPGTTAALLHPDGTREIIRKSTTGSDGITVPLTGPARLEIIDNAKRFSDIPENNWASEAVAYVSSHELFSGTGTDTFTPDAPMTRGMLAVVLHNLENNPEPPYSIAFQDVGASSWHTGAIAWASAENIVSSYGNGLFGPNDNITREQLAVMLWRYAGCPAADKQNMSFSDIDTASSYALDALQWAVKYGIISGYTDNTLSPQEPATRAQTAQMLKNFAENYAARMYW